MASSKQIHIHHEWPRVNSGPRGNSNLIHQDTLLKNRIKCQNGKMLGNYGLVDIDRKADNAIALSGSGVQV